MDTLTAARAQMELSLAFHMVFAALGIGIPPMMVIAEVLYLRTGEAHYQRLAMKWSKAAAILFVVGAVSGTALSFELGLLWPRFMAFAGPIIGPAFALEGYAFFLEAIFVGLYLYGWDRLSPRQHVLCGIPVAVSGMLSGVLVVGANAWMQAPGGYDGVVAGVAQNVDPLACFKNPVWLEMALHSTLSCYVAVGFATAGVYAVGVLRGRGDAYHLAGLRIAMAVGTLAALLQPLSGHLAAHTVAEANPAKLAAMEAHFVTGRDVPALIGGLPDTRTKTVRYAIEIPFGLSFLATGDIHGEVKGLDSVPADQQPNVWLCHVAFQVMVGGGMTVLGVGLLFHALRLRKKVARSTPRWLFGAIAGVSPLGFLALEAGWIVSEAGRQPWTIYQVMRTRDAVTSVTHVGVTFWLFAGLYLALAAIVVLLLRHLAAGDHAAAH